MSEKTTIRLGVREGAVVLMFSRPITEIDLSQKDAMEFVGGLLAAIKAARSTPKLVTGKLRGLNG